MLLEVSLRYTTTISYRLQANNAAAVYPGQNLLLAEAMDVFTSSDLVKDGDFVSLMYFVIGLGASRALASRSVYLGLGSRPS